METYQGMKVPRKTKHLKRKLTQSRKGKYKINSQTFLSKGFSCAN